MYTTSDVSVRTIQIVNGLIRKYELPIKIKEREGLSRKRLNLVFGATNLKAIDKKLKFTESRGFIHEIDGCKILPTVTGEAVDNDPTNLYYLLRDLRYALSDKPRVKPMRKWSVLRTRVQLDDFLQKLESSPAVSVDIETSGLDPREDGAYINSIQFGLSNGYCVAVPLSKPGAEWSEDYDSCKTVLEDILKATEGKSVIGHNFKFDNIWLDTIYGIRFYLGFDTMLASHVLDENMAHGLKSLSQFYCDAPNYDLTLEEKLGKGQDEKKFYEYGCLDVYYTMKLYKKFSEELDSDPGLRRLFEVVVMPAARLMEVVDQNGFYLNASQYRETRTRLVELQSKLLDEMNQTAGQFMDKPVNWNSPAQIGELLFKKMKLPILKKTATGNPATSEDVLKQLAQVHELPDTLMKYREVSKKINTYLDGWESLRHGDKIYFSTKLHGTVTGRFSSRLHQVPRDPEIRSLITAPKGWVFVCADYSQIELRLAAHMSGDSAMIEAFQNKEDIHSKTASIILHKEPEELTKEERKMAKAVNFGLLYGMGWRKLIEYSLNNYGVEMTDGQAQTFRDRYFQTYAGLLPWHERCRKFVRDNGYAQSPSGRRRRLPGVYSDVEAVKAQSERQSINSPVQGFGSGDLKTMAMVEIGETFSNDVVQIVGEVHDSVLLRIRKTRLAKVVPKLKKIMENPKRLKLLGVKMTVPLVVDIEVGPWGQGEKYE